MVILRVVFFTRILFDLEFFFRDPWIYLQNYGIHSKDWNFKLIQIIKAKRFDS